jgi:hypothetical protein
MQVCKNDAVRSTFEKFANQEQSCIECFHMTAEENAEEEVNQTG